MKTIVIWGTGRRAATYMENNYFEQCNIIGFIDTYPKRDDFCGYKVYRTDALSTLAEKVDYIVVANQFFGENYDICAKYGIDRRKLIFTDNVKEKPFENDLNSVKAVSEKLYKKQCVSSYIRFICMNEADNLDENRLTDSHGYDNPSYSRVYFLYRTFELCAEEIIKNGVQGKIAELGVFQGNFAAMINEKFKDRELFLFDTFEGFDEDEAELEIAKGRCDKEFKERYKGTNLEMVRKKLKYPEKCTFYQGFFPDTVDEEAENAKYAFVSLDVDLEESTYQGLKFFYPRIVRGGVLFCA